MIMDEYSVIGKRLPRVDGVMKVTGKAKYTTDLVLPGMLHGKIIRSPYPHARILNIDTSKAEKLLGVRTIIKGSDFNEIKIGLFGDPAQLDEPFLAVDRVRFIGEGVAAVAAIDEEIAEEALELIKVEYEELPSLFSMEEAIKEGSYQIHEGTERNIAMSFSSGFGDIDKGFRESYYIREDRFSLSPLNSCSMETLVSIADFTPDGKLSLWSPTQTPFFLRKQLSRALNMREGDIRVINPFMGGAHCSTKHEALTHHISSALLSKKAGHPVKIELSREEVFNINRGAPPVTIYIKTGVKKNGEIVAKKYEIEADCGAYKGMSPLFLYLSYLYANFPYRLQNLKYEGRLIYTNNPPNATQRSCGLVSINIADESHLGIISEELGMDPFEIRLKNALREGDITKQRVRITSCGLSESIRMVREKLGWNGDRAIGVACEGCPSGAKAFLPHDTSSAFINIHEDGTVTLFTGLPELGQGSDTVMAQIAAEILGVSLEDIKVISGDTEGAPMDLGSYGSRGTFQGGNAVKNAALDARSQLLMAAAEKLSVKIDDLIIRERNIWVKNDPGKRISVAEAVEFSQNIGGKPVMGKGYYNPSSDFLDPLTFKGNISLAYSFGAHGVELKVDEETGEVGVINSIMAHDCGFPLNPMSVEGQIEGQISQGLGQAFFERRFLENGQQLNPNLLDYKIPTSLEMPPVTPILVETIDPNGPFGAKECGEGPQVGFIGAIINAVYKAVGVRIKKIPLTPEIILKAIDEKRRRRR
jgi:4-hydroxybenzoyl-CoA reductase subunit alpha